eukprot:CAMPEP_0180779282 /NCGR_PEP_ID=MMETSP1038_2-20121128/46299_1 /TAXON_ID=632150 /ORGANISM="Azadinium spinosum, Strain 3D9" /LENGTH=259 /DNA_ID=CAMNT_0022814557 /DNA_START=97 /DNA_END=874 /DNA_ORIENTATION=+
MAHYRAGNFSTEANEPSVGASHSPALSTSTVTAAAGSGARLPRAALLPWCASFFCGWLGGQGRRQHRKVQRRVDEGRLSELRWSWKEEMLEAVGANKLQEVERLLGEHPFVDADISDGRTPLYCAAIWGFPEMAQLLIRAGADVNARAAEGGFPLRCTAVALSLPGPLSVFNFVGDDSFQKRMAVMKILIESGADVNMKDPDGDTALHAAAVHGRLESVKLLVQAGADTAAANVQGQTPLRLAEVEGHAQIVEYLKTFE